MSMHVIAHGGCVNTVRQSALGADSRLSTERTLISAFAISHYEANTQELISALNT